MVNYKQKILINSHTRKTFSCLFTFVIYLTDILYFSINGIKLINSDSSAELILSRLLNQTGGIITDKWYYSTELRMINTQLVYRIGLALFPTDWHLARTFSVAVFLLILIAAALYCVHAAELGSIGLIAVSILICPFGQWYAWNIIYDSYYIPHVVISLLSIGLVLRVLRNKGNRWNPVRLILLAILCFLAGLGGIRQLMICYTPLCLTAMLLFWNSFRKIQSFHSPKAELAEMKEECVFLGLSILTLLSSGIGYFINSRILSEKYHFKSYETSMWGKFTFTGLINSYSDFASMFGWQQNIEIIGKSGVINILGLMLGMLTLVMIIILAIRLDFLSFPHRILVLFVLSFIILNGLIFSNNAYYETAYWIPILPFAIILLAVGYRYVKKHRGRMESAVYAVFILTAVILCSISTMLNPYPYSNDSSIPTDKNLLVPSEWLENNGYTQGYASLWDSSIVTELTNGKIEMWTILAGDPQASTDSLPILKWLQPVSHDTDIPSGKFFILGTEWEFSDKNAPALSKMSKYLVYKDSYYLIYGFNSMAEYQDLIKNNTNNKSAE